MSSKNERAYVLVIIEPGKEQDFANEILSKGLILDPKVDRMDFVHGSFDFIIIFNGSRQDIDMRIMALRKLQFVRRTETLFPFEMLNWEEIQTQISGAVDNRQAPSNLPLAARGLNPNEAV